MSQSRTFVLSDTTVVHLDMMRRDWIQLKSLKLTADSLINRQYNLIEKQDSIIGTQAKLSLSKDDQIQFIENKNRKKTNRYKIAIISLIIAFIIK